MKSWSLWTRFHWFPSVLVYLPASSLAFSAIFLTATPNPASGFANVATTTSNTSGAMRTMLWSWCGFGLNRQIITNCLVGQRVTNILLPFRTGQVAI